MEVQELRRLSLFDGLDDDQLGVLAAAAEEVACPPGVDLWHEGKPATDWWVLLEGTVSLSRRVGTEETVLGAMTHPGQWAGGFGAWDEHGVYFATGRSADGARCMRVSAETLRECSHAWFPFGVHFIEGLVNTVRRVEAGARQREALVALGSLAAGLAHELNNPAAAATRAVDALEETSRALLDAASKPSRSGPVTTNPLSSRTISSPSHAVRGEAPMKTKSQLVSTSHLSPVSRWVRTMDRKWSSPRASDTSVRSRTSTLPALRMRSTRYCDIVVSRLLPRTSITTRLA